MDITSISSAYTSLKIMREAVAALLDAKIESAAKQHINDALDKIGSVQDTLFYLREELSRLQAENHILSDKLKDKEEWDARIAEYQLEETAGGAVVYSFKRKPSHYACPSCINKKEIHILQDRRVLSGIFDCPGCAKTFPINPSQPLKGRAIIHPGLT